MKQIISVIFLLTTKIIVLVLLGLRIQHRERLPTTGPAILVANHNSHLDTPCALVTIPFVKGAASSPRRQ